MKELICFGLKQIAERVNVPRGNDDKQEASTFLKGEEISDRFCRVCASGRAVQQSLQYLY